MTAETRDINNAQKEGVALVARAILQADPTVSPGAALRSNHL